MIQIHCTNCKTLLTIDEGFAGGVCRCRYCGTIQTVPKQLRSGSDGSGSGILEQAAGAHKKSKTLYQKKSSAVADLHKAGGTGLDELAEIVASSGLSSARLRKASSGTPFVDRAAVAAPAPVPSKRLLAVLLGVGVTIVLLLGILIVLAVRARSGGNSSQVPSASAQAQAQGQPALLGVPLSGRKIVFLLDRGQSSLTGGRLDLLKEAVSRAVEHLSPQQEFQVIFWSVNNQVIAWPEDGPVAAIKENTAACRKKLEDVWGAGQSKIQPSLEQALRSKPDTIVLVSTKTFLDEEFYAGVKHTRGDAAAKVHCLSIDQPELGEVLKKIAAESGGTYRDVSMTELRIATQ